MTTETASRKGIGGPKTPEGKAKVRLNAFKTGLYSESSPGMRKVAEVVGVTFESVLEKMTAFYRPFDAIEEALVRRIARCTWKLQVIETIEDYQLETTAIGREPDKWLEGISVIERRTDVQLHRAIAALTAKRREDARKMKNKLAAIPPPGKWPRPEPEFEQDSADAARIATREDDDQPAQSPAADSGDTGELTPPTKQGVAKAAKRPSGGSRRSKPPVSRFPRLGALVSSVRMGDGA